MEGMEQFNTNIDEEQLKQITREIQAKFTQAAEEHLPEGDEKREQIIRFYSDFDRLQRELNNVLAGQTSEEATKRIAEVEEEILNNKEAFLEFIQDKDYSIAGQSDVSFREGK